MVKDEELRSLLRKRGYRVLELCYNSYSDKRRDELYREILDSLGREQSGTITGGAGSQPMVDAGVSEALFLMQLQLLAASGHAAA